MANDTAPAVIMMTKTEAKEALGKINDHVGAFAALVLDFYKREGWRALGYKSWTDCAEKEFGHGKRRIFQLLDEAQARETTGAPQLSGRAARALKDVPPAKQADVVKAAQKEHKTPAPTETQIRQTAAKKKAWAPSGVKKRNQHTPRKQEPIAEQAKNDEPLQKALAILGGTCGRPFRKAIEEETIEMSRHDIIHLSEQDDETMVQAEKLISVNRWPLKRALAFLIDMPTLQTKLEQLCWHATASPEDKWEGTFGAFTVTVEVNRRKL